MIRRLAPPEPKLDWAMDVTGRQVTQLTRLVEDLLDVARINQRKIAPQVEPLDMRAVIAHATETARPFIEGRRHQLRVSVPDTTIMMRGDFARLSQVVANLLNNAAKYTEEGGLIELSLTLPAQGQAGSPSATTAWASKASCCPTCSSCSSSASARSIGARAGLASA